MNFLGSAMSCSARYLNRWLANASRDPDASQRKVLRHLIKRASGTWFAQEHNFRSIRSHEDFVKAVRIRDYVGRLEMFSRMMDGEPDVSWPGRVKYFCQTSGTTAGEKYLPITPEIIKANNLAAMSIFACYSRRGMRELGYMMKGKLLFLGGSTSLEKRPSGALVGDLSGIASRYIRWPIKSHYEPGAELALLDSWEEKVSRVAERVARKNITFVTGMPSWVKILFDRVCEIRGIDPAGGISRIWPNFQLFVHGGVNFAPYRPTFMRYFDPAHKIDFLEVYPASEGFIGVQPNANDPSMEMFVDNGIFFEFVPLSEWSNPDPPRLTIGQVEKDVPYCLVISTCAGLWAYDIGDVVRFTSIDPPRIRFAGRNRQFINAFGENIIGEQVTSAVAAAATKTQAKVAEFTAAPLYPGNGRHVGAHEYVIEFEVPPTRGTDEFARAIDDELKKLNNDYSTKRKGDMGMTPVEITQVPKGTFYGWMNSRGQLGGQHKVPVCANDRKFVEEIAVLLNETPR